MEYARVNKLLPFLQKAIAEGVTLTIHTNNVESYETSKQAELLEAIMLLREIGVQLTMHQALQQRIAIIDEKIVWYGSVDFLAFGRRDSNALRFVDSDTAGEFLALYQEAPGEQMIIEEA